MGIMNKLFGFPDRNVPNKVNSKNYGGSIAGFFSSTTDVDEDAVMSIPAFYAGVNMICSSIAEMPINLVGNVDNHVGKEPVDDYRANLLNTKVNDVLNGIDFKKKIVKDMILYGVSKSVIEAQGGKISKLYPLDMSKLTTTVYTDNGYSFFAESTLNSSAKSTTFMDEELLSIFKKTDDGIIGHGILEEAKTLIDLAVKQQKFEKQIIANGAMPTGIVSSKGGMGNGRPTDSNMKTMADQFNGLYAGVDNAGRTIFLPPDHQYQKVSMSPSDLQLNDGKNSLLSDVARILNIPESLINSSANKYNSLEQNQTSYIKQTIFPLITAIETSLNNMLLTDFERKQGYEFKFETGNSERMTVSENNENVSKLFRNGIITNIVAKRMLGMTIEPNEKEYYQYTTGTTFYVPDKNMVINPNMGSTANLDTGEVLGGKNNTSNNEVNNDDKS